MAQRRNRAGLWGSVQETAVITMTDAVAVAAGDPIGIVTATSKGGIYNDAAVDGLEDCRYVALADLDSTDTDRRLEVLVIGAYLRGNLTANWDAAAEVDVQGDIRIIEDWEVSLI